MEGVTCKTNLSTRGLAEEGVEAKARAPVGVEGINQLLAQAGSVSVQSAGTRKPTLPDSVV